MSEPGPGSIRPGDEQDLNGMAALFVRVFGAPPYQEDWEFAVARRYLADLLESSTRLAYVVPGPDGTTAGFLLGACHGIVRAVVYEIAVDQRFRRRGIGSALLDRFVEDAAARSVRAVELLARRDLPAFRFYRRRGFRLPRRVTLLIRSLEAR